jgi:hypothetical protein
LPALFELLKKSSPLSNQEVPDKQTLNSFNNLFYLTADGNTLAQPQQLIGSAWSREIITNIGLPIRQIFARAGKFKELETGLYAFFRLARAPAITNYFDLSNIIFLALRRKCSGSSTLRKTKTEVDAGVSGFLHSERE